MALIASGRQNTGVRPEVSRDDTLRMKYSRIDLACLRRRLPSRTNGISPEAMQVDAHFFR